MLRNPISYLVLPGPISDFERKYLARMNRIGLWFFLVHLPVFMLIAGLNGQSVLQAFSLTSFVLAGPIIAERSLQNPRNVSLVYGFTSMLMGGLLVHFGQGPVQIEMHFYFFALLAMLAVFGNPMAIVVAAVTVALHHLAAWMWVPKSVFNYDAPIWVVLVHAAFVVLESVATCFIARSFFDNVIGLEKIVNARTVQLDARNRDMRLVLDTVHQGFLTIDRAMIMSPEKSAVVSTWFGPAEERQTFTDYLGLHDAAFAESFRTGWDQLLAEWLPLELTIDQLPKRFALNERHFSLDYTPIMRDGALDQMLVMISDISADVVRERLEAEQHDVLQILRRVAKDKAGVLEFVSEACELVNGIADPTLQDTLLMKRRLHTLKGNSMIFGVQTIASMCHTMEDELDESGEMPPMAARHGLQEAWNKLCVSIDMLLGSRENPRLEVDDGEYEELLRAILRGENSDQLAHQLRTWKLEPTARRLLRAAEQAQGVATRLHKPALKINVEDHQLRLSPRDWASFWTAFVHVIRNAVDHGVEDAETRRGAGKSPEGQLTLCTRVEHDDIVISIADDGRGIDWQAIARRARELGLPFQTHDELVEAMFADGVSTRSDVNEYSGRGIGMGVVREACRSRGGFIRVDSEPGRGTCVEFHFPQRASQMHQLRRAS